MAEAATELRSDDRAHLERIAYLLGLSRYKRAQLLLEFQAGQLAWFEPRPIRLPASALDELARGTGAGVSLPE